MLRSVIEKQYYACLSPQPGYPGESEKCLIDSMMKSVSTCSVTCWRVLKGAQGLIFSQFLGWTATLSIPKGLACFFG